MSRETKFGRAKIFTASASHHAPRFVSTATTQVERPQLFAPRAMTGTTREAKSDMVRARVADEATKVAVPVIVRKPRVPSRRTNPFSRGDQTASFFAQKSLGVPDTSRSPADPAFFAPL
jgi:hypothetical protein